MDVSARRRSVKRYAKQIRLNWELFLFVLPAVVYLIIFSYIPMGGILIAFKNFKPHLGIFGSEWAGARYFERFFTMPMFPVIMRNTLSLSFYQLLAGFPLPVLLALALNSCRYGRFKKVVQTVTYAPHFISIVVIIGMINVFFSPSTGIVANALAKLGLSGEPLMILSSPSAFPHLYVWSGIWAGIGWGSIIYLGALASVDPSLHESAMVDGATKFKRVLHIDIPAILPTVVIMLILESGKIMSVGFEKAFLMQNSLNIGASEIINTYVYKIGIREGQYSLSTAIGLFNSAVNYAMIMLVNWIAGRLGESSLW
ncbi:MAG: ABC transporter permease subunit [Clostridiales bacterium]|nr:ABC transporter permease subunit [Clostridiales bacterium]